MKKIMILMMVMSIILVGCSGDDFDQLKTEEVIESLQKQTINMNKVVIYNENNDPNELLGRQGQYIGKASWTDSRTETNKLNCTIEVFDNEESLNKRKEYLKEFTDNPMFNQYVYVHKNIIMRINGKLTPSEAKRYKGILKTM